MSFYNILQSPDLVMWYSLLKVPTLFIVLFHYMSWDYVKDGIPEEGDISDN